MRPLPRSFFDRNAALVAPDLLGCLLLSPAGRGRYRAARVVETEAYVGEHDLACHARVGRTARTATLYGPPGRAYVYLIYGMHHCLNAVCGPGSDANAVLLRAAAPLDEAALRAAGLDPKRALPLLHSATGPGNLCKAFAITREHDRVDLCGPRSPLRLLPRQGAPRTVRGPRIGVDYAGDWAHELLRFCDADSSHVSRPRPGRAADGMARPRSKE